MENRGKEKTTILRRKQVEARTGLARSTIYLRIQDGTFPRPINLGARAVGWLESEVTDWIAGCIAARFDEKHCAKNNFGKEVNRDQR